MRINALYHTQGNKPESVRVTVYEETSLKWFSNGLRISAISHYR